MRSPPASAAPTGEEGAGVDDDADADRERAEAEAQEAEDALAAAGEEIEGIGNAVPTLKLVMLLCRVRRGS